MDTADINKQPIRSFAVLDLETSNLPDFNFNKVAITELCIYGFSVKDIEQLSNANRTGPPARPRILHKLTLVFNPRMMIHPAASAVTGLDNYMLEEESHFDENAANMVLNFLTHLQAPVCLIAHNGFNFDFPIVKKAFEKLQMVLPAETLCIDSLLAFQVIDEERALAPQISTADSDEEKDQSAVSVSETTTTLSDALIENENIDWRTINETTPSRPKLSPSSASMKRKLLAEVHKIEAGVQTTENISPDVRKRFKSRRSLFSSPTTSYKPRRKFPPKGVYKLGEMYKRIFGEAPEISHFAEADVDVLMKLVLHYGQDFVDYAEKHAFPFAEMQAIGRRFNR